MPFTPFEKAVAVLYFLATIAFYAVFTWYKTRPYGASIRARFDTLLSYREPAIVLDSARFIALLGWMRNTPDVEMATDYLRRGVVWTDPVGVFKWVSVLSVPPASVPITIWIYRLALLLAVAGVMGRGASAVAAVLHALLWSIGYSTVGYSVHNHVVFMILIGLALAPEPFVPIWKYGQALREKRPLTTAGTYHSYVRVVAALAIGILYVQTGIEKVLHGSPRWFNGITLQAHAMRKGQLSIEIGRLPMWMLIALAFGVVIWETLYGLVFYYRKLRPLGVLSGWSFHEFVRHIMGVTPFAFMMTGVLFVYTPYEAWSFVAERLSKKKRPDLKPALPSPEEAKRSSPTWRTPTVLAIVVLFVVQWIPTGLRRGVYPFLGNAMFSSSQLRGDMITAEGRAVVKRDDGTEHEVRASEAIATHQITFTELVYVHYRSPYKDHQQVAQGKAQQYCQDILRSIVKNADPRAVELTLFLDYFSAGELDLKTDLVQTCRLTP